MKNKNLFINNIYKWIKWITVINSWINWKNIWVFAITHWNEPVWLQVFDYLFDKINIKWILKKWKLFLIAINIRAYNKYILEWSINDNRFIDNNMNRISNKKNKLWSIEFKRFNELKIIFDEIDIAIDLHSVSKWHDIIGITDNKYLSVAQKFFNVDTILVDNLWRTWAIIWYFLRNGKEAYWLECWNHIDKRWLKIWVINLLNLLTYKWFINKEIYIDRKNINMYKFINEIYPKTTNFRYLKNFVWFTKIISWEIFAIDWKKELKNNMKKDIYLWIVKKIPKKWDWVGFLFEKIN